jgi:uncharacterized repeat protein (TIGR01451 family)
MLSRFGQWIAQNIMLMSMAVLVLSGGIGALVAIQPGFANHSECSDGLDNDRDTRIDYPQDDQCESLDDDAEGVSLSGLFVSVTDSRDTVSPGASVIYTISLRQQRDDIRNVDVSLHLPAQANFASANEGGAIRDGIVRWSRVTVDRNNTAYLTVHANLLPNIPEGTLLVARVLTEGIESSDTTTVRGVPMPSLTRQFAVSIDDGQELARPGDVLHYIVRVKNLSDVSNVTNLTIPLPSIVGFLNASAGSEILSDKIIWKKAHFSPGEEQTFSFTVRVAPHLYKFASVHMRATAGSVSSVDDTLLISGSIQSSLSASITDGRNTAERGEILTYTVIIRNLSDRLVTDAYVGASLPIYGEFVSATEGGKWDGLGVHWAKLQVAARGERRLTYQVRVRSDAPANAVLRASATLQDSTVDDETTVIGNVSVRDRTPVRLPVRDGIYPPVPHDEYGNDYDYDYNDNDHYIDDRDGKGEDKGEVLFRKRASAAETVPGGKVTYTLTVKNVLNHPIYDTVISDRFDPSLLSFVSSQDLVERGAAGSIRFYVPTLQPGETWKATYVLSVNKNAPKGLSLSNIATISGPDLRDLTLTSRVTVGSMGVVRSMPKTGASMDLLFLLITMPLGLLAGALQRKITL